MPLVQIHLIKNTRTPNQLRGLADVIQKCMREHFAAPAGDRYQVITQHEPYELICEDTGLNIKRSEKLVLINILQQGRDEAKKQALYANLASELKAKCDVGGEDLIISVAANAKEDWSFGHGRAQFLTGEL